MAKSGQQITNEMKSCKRKMHSEIEILVLRRWKDRSVESTGWMCTCQMKSNQQWKCIKLVQLARESFLCGSTSIAVDGFTLILSIPWPKRWLKYLYGTRFQSTVCLSHAYQIHFWTMCLLCHWQYQLVMHCSGHLNYCYIDRLDHCVRNVTQNTFLIWKIGFYR